MTVRYDVQGERFGKLVAIEHVGYGKWRCKCDCGKETIARVGPRHGAKSCGRCTRWRRRPLMARIMEKLSVPGPDECWEFMGARAKGYGTIGSSDTPREAIRQLLVHRVMWEEANGPIPDGLFVLHRCDNPPCCNPSHLFLGTAKDNAIDCRNKGRGANGAGPGEKHNCSKLSDAQRAEIYTRKEAGETQTSLSREFGVCRTTIWNAHAWIKKRKVPNDC